VLVVGSRLSDFTTASYSAFANPDVRFVSINVAELDAHKLHALPLVGDARATLDELEPRMAEYRVPPEYASELGRLKGEWEAEVDRVCGVAGGASAVAVGAELARPNAMLTQAAVIGVLNAALQPRDVIVCAAGSLPGDLHKLWRSRDAKGYHLEYGYSCMGYEIAGGVGVKLAAPERDVFVLVGDGSYLMMAQEIVTAVQEGIKITIVLLDNHGFSSIGGLSESVGCGGFGTEYRRRGASGHLDGEYVPVDFAANAASLGAEVLTATTRDGLATALTRARSSHETMVIVVPVDRNARVSGYDSWWDVPVAETSTVEAVRDARRRYDRARERQRHHF
jgi:3D-(3,5/4)-trihydroxycyclohexane-1,2-dione acylhydrolase (decyclizing)